MSSFFADLIADLKAKHLWPVALILLVLLVAVPLLLSKPAKQADVAVPPPSTTTAPPAGSGPGGFQSIADVTPIVKEQPQFSEQSKKDRQFERKNPFAGLPPGTGAGTATTTGTSAGGDTGGGTTGTTYPLSGDNNGDGVVYFHWVATVRFGEEGKQQKTRKLTTLRALPDSNSAILVFLGVQSSNHTAVFLMSSSATTTGDGTCVPSDDECSFLYLKQGDVQTIEAVSSSGEVTTYELKLMDVKIEKTDNPSGNNNNGNSSGDSGDPTASGKSGLSVAPAAPANQRSTPAASKVGRRAQARTQRKSRREQRARRRQAARVVEALGF